MIDKKKLEAIRAEIERFRKTNKVSEDKEYAQYELDVKCGYDMALDDMLSYINSISEEPVSDRFAFKAIPRLLEMIEPTDRAKSYVAKLADAFDSEGYYTDAKIVRESLKIMNGEKVPMATMDKEPVSEELEQAAEEYEEKGRIDAFVSRKRDFINGAKWQKTKDESTTEDLGEYINELSKQFPEVSFAKLSRIAVRVAKWQMNKLPKWRPTPIQGGCWPGEIGVRPTARLFVYEHYSINADKLFKLLNRED